MFVGDLRGQLTCQSAAVIASATREQWNNRCMETAKRLVVEDVDVEDSGQDDLRKCLDV